MFLHHTRSPLLVVQKKPLPVVQEYLTAFYVGQAFRKSIWPGGIHLAMNQIATVTMCLCHARSPLPVVQGKP